MPHGLAPGVNGVGGLRVGPPRRLPGTPVAGPSCSEGAFWHLGEPPPDPGCLQVPRTKLHYFVLLGQGEVGVRLRVLAMNATLGDDNQRRVSKLHRPRRDCHPGLSTGARKVDGGDSHRGRLLGCCRGGHPDQQSAQHQYEGAERQKTRISHDSGLLRPVFVCQAPPCQGCPRRFSCSRRCSCGEWGAKKH